MESEGIRRSQRESGKARRNQGVPLGRRKGDHMRLLAITACTVGVAHTFMAAESLEKTAVSRGHQMKVETQGAGGIENRLTKEDIEQADGVIFAVDTGVMEEERFRDIPVLECKTKDAISRPEKIFEKLEKVLKQ